MHKEVDADGAGGKGLVNISRLPKSAWPNLLYERIYFSVKKILFILQPSQTL